MRRGDQGVLLVSLISKAISRDSLLVPLVGIGFIYWTKVRRRRVFLKTLRNHRLPPLSHFETINNIKSTKCLTTVGMQRSEGYSPTHLLTLLKSILDPPRRTASVKTIRRHHKHSPQCRKTLYHQRVKQNPCQTSTTGRRR